MYMFLLFIKLFICLKYVTNFYKKKCFPFADDIRCYCNLPRCVATGYMCRTARSTIGGCFSEVRNNNDKSETRHGCIELLQNE